MAPRRDRKVAGRGPAPDRPEGNGVRARLTTWRGLLRFRRSIAVGPTGRVEIGAGGRSMETVSGAGA